MRRLLLVEDGLLNRQLAKTLLERDAGFEVVVAENGAMALDAIERCEAFEAVLMDLDMPVMDGFEAVAAIRARGDAKGEVPIIAMSVMTRRSDVARARRVGVDGHIAKPFDPSRLWIDIEACLARIAHPFADPAPAGPARAPPLPVWNRGTFDELFLHREPARVSQTLALFRGRLDQAVEALGRPSGAGRLRAEAEALASGAAVLGFEALAAECRLLCAGPEAGAPAPVLPLRSAAERALAEIGIHAAASASSPGGEPEGDEPGGDEADGGRPEGCKPEGDEPEGDGGPEAGRRAGEASHHGP